MIESQFEYTIIDDLYNKLTQKILVIISILIICLSIPFILDRAPLGYTILVLTIVPFWCCLEMRIKMIGIKYFTINNESIQIIFPKDNSKNWVIDDIRFQITWETFDKIIVEKNKIETFKYLNPRQYLILRFIGSSSICYPLNRFHKIKQLEIKLLLQQYAKQMGKDYLEKELDHEVSSYT